MEIKRQIVILSTVAQELRIKNYHGICAVIHTLFETDKISKKEYIETFQFLDANKPTPENQYKEFTENVYWVGGVYWWKNMLFYENTRRIRISYLNKLINNLNNIIYNDDREKN